MTSRCPQSHTYSTTSCSEPPALVIVVPVSNRWAYVPSLSLVCHCCVSSETAVNAARSEPRVLTSGHCTVGHGDPHVPDCSMTVAILISRRVPGAPRSSNVGARLLPSHRLTGLMSGMNGNQESVPQDLRSWASPYQGGVGGGSAGRSRDPTQSPLVKGGNGLSFCVASASSR